MNGALREQLVQEARDAPLAPGNHPYLLSKGMGGNPHHLAVDTHGNLLLAVQDIEGHITSLQRISPEGGKSFLKGGRIEGSHGKLSGWNVPNAGTLVIVEGYATAATIERNVGLPVAALSAGNLGAVAQAYRDKFPDIVLIIAGDNDHRNWLETGLDGRAKANVGRDKAEGAAQRFGGPVSGPVCRGP